MRLLRALLRLFRCQHEDALRVRDEAGVLWLVCLCGRRVQAIQRSDDERETMRETFRQPMPAKAVKAKAAKRKAATVEAFRKRGLR